MNKAEKPRLFFNSAGASLMPKACLDAMTSHLELESQFGGYEAQRQKAKEINQVYDSLARFLNCHRDEIALMENATAAWHVALQAIGLKSGDEIITIESEYVSNYLMFLHLQKHRDLKIHVIPNDAQGHVCLATLKEKINDQTRLISIPHVPTNSGRINPVEKIGQFDRPENCFYLVDACQSVGQMTVDVAQINCDFLSATSRKFIRGPRGVGFLYIHKKRLASLDPVLIDLQGGQLQNAHSYVLDPSAKRFENKERNIAAVLGFGASIDVALSQGLDQIYKTNKKLSDYLRAQLSQIEQVTLHAEGDAQCAIVTFYVEHIASGDLADRLRGENIYTATIVPDGAILESERLQLPDLIRVSVHYDNTTEEIDLFIEALQKAIENAL